MRRRTLKGGKWTAQVSTSASFKTYRSGELDARYTRSRTSRSPDHAAEVDLPDVYERVLPELAASRLWRSVIADALLPG